MDEQSGESKEDEVIGEEIDESDSEIEELVCDQLPRPTQLQLVAK